MKPKRQIGVIVNMPTSPEGIARLNERLLELNSYVLGRALAQIDAPYAAKIAYLESLDGIAPWATPEARARILAERAQQKQQSAAQAQQS